ncbi:hypothetical protein MMC07_009002 [Pseudocyphellaria aurata]|nr:hypothetical protein [Pseudocyphellaria aurata]
MAGDPQQLSDCTGPCTVAQEAGYSVGVTVTKGASLEFSEIVGVGLDVSVAITTENSKTSSVGIDCDGPWTCGAVVTPQMMHVKGDKFHNKNQGCGEDRQPYEVTFPVLDDDKVPLYHLEACLCKDYDHWREAKNIDACPKPCTPHSDK